MTSTVPAYIVQMGDAAVFSIPEERAQTHVSCVDGLLCVFAGRLSNDSEVAREVGVEGATNPAQLAIAGYRQYGERIVARLDGTFALAMWNAGTETLWCASDAMGQHPFYYAPIGSEIVVSWDLLSILRHPKVSRRLNRAVLAEILCGRFLDQQETCFEEIRRLAGGHALRFRRGRLEVFPWWKPPLPENGDWVTKDELARFPEIFKQAIESTLRFGAPGILLSGGLDSLSIAAWTRDICHERGMDAPHVYSLILSDHEGRIQRAAAERLGFRHTLVHMKEYVEAGGFLRNVLALAPIFPSPSLSFLATPFLGLQRHAVEDNCGVLLTGDGGDEWLTVNPVYAADLIRAGDFRGLLRLARTQWAHWGSESWSMLGLARDIGWSFGLREVIRGSIVRQAPGLVRFRRRLLRRRAIPDWIAPDPDLRRQLADRFDGWTRPADGGMAYFDATLQNLADPLRAHLFEERFYRDRHAGIPTMHPFWDRRVVEFLLRVRPEDLNQGLRSKALVRGMLAARFPDLGLQNQHKMLAPQWFEEILRREGPELIPGIQRSRLLADTGLVDVPRYVDMLTSGGPKDSVRLLHRTWRAASVEAWLGAQC